MNSSLQGGGGVGEKDCVCVHAPVAPTDQCIRMLRELDAPVEYIVLPTYAYEHKVFVGPFSRKFPKAKVREGGGEGGAL